MANPLPRGLEELRDIHLPQPIGWWPLAPGWYFLAALIILLIILAIFFLRRYYLNSCAKREALALLKTYHNVYELDQNSQLSSAQVSELLKRVALSYFSRAEVASLQGDAWILFLNKTAKKLNFEEIRAELLEMPYQPRKDCDLTLLFNMAKQWISQRRGPCLN